MRSFDLSPLRFAAVVSLVAVSLSGCTTISTLVDAYGGPATPVETPQASATASPTGLVSLEVGDCLDQALLEDGDTATDPIVDCAKPHDLEVFESIPITETEYPAVETLVSDATKKCATAFTTFVGLDFGISALDFQYYYPTESSWANGDRAIDCVIFDPTTRTTDTLRGSKR